jgi:hypothetical protein
MVLIPLLYATSQFPRISKRPVRGASNHNIRWWILYQTQDHSRTPPRKCRRDATPSRRGYDKIATPLGSFELSFVLFVHAMIRLMYVNFFFTMNDLLCLRALTCILFTSCHAKVFMHHLYYLWGHTLKNFKLSGGLTVYLMTFSQCLSLCKLQLFIECLD